MSKYVKITFGSDDLSISKKGLEEAKDEHVALLKEELKLNRIDPDSMEDIFYKKERDKIQSIRKNEKDIMVQLFENALNLDKKVTSMNQIIDSIENVEGSEEEAILPQEDVERLLKAYETLKDIPKGWTKFKQLFKQIANPEEVEVEVKKVEENK